MSALSSVEQKPDGQERSSSGTVLGRVLVAVICVLSLRGNCVCADDSAPLGNAVIRAAAGNSEIVITTTTRLAGAIHSLTWNGKEFVNSADHGRQIQSASNFDAGMPFTPETFNPTEAGSVKDGAGPTSSSRLLHLIANGRELQTTNQMTFWLAPDGQSQGHPAKNTTVLSDHLLTKRVRIGFSNLMVEIWGEVNGKGARSAVGMGSLPSNIAVEVEAVFQLKP